jgi:hypothetical protein
MNGIRSAILDDRVLIHAQRKLAGELHHAEVRAVVVAEKRGARRGALDHDRLRSDVPVKDRPRLCIDVDVGLNEIRKVAPPPPDAAPSHVE